MCQQTLGIIKPDGVARDLIGAVLARVEASGLRITGLRMVYLSPALAEAFYAVHRGKPFYADLVSYMASGPIVVARLEGDGAIARWRELMGATDPAAAASGTLRAEHGVSLGRNTVHGSDAPETAAVELDFFFGDGPAATADATLTGADR